jgi:ferredoxin
MRIMVDADLCEANAVCMNEAPEVFLVDEEGRLRVLAEQPSPDLLKEVKRAVARCPRGALSLVDD